MRTLYLRNVPEDIYAALRKRARENGTSISAEVLGLLRLNVPSARELARRRELLNRVLRNQGKSGGAGPSTEEMVRQDREG